MKRVSSLPLFFVAAQIAVQIAGAVPAVRFAVIADQTGSPVPGVYDSVLDQVARMDPDFVLTVGDQVDGYVGPDTSALRTQFDGVFAQYDRAFGPRWRTGQWLVLCPGNHDITDDAAEPIWRKRVGPTYRRVDLSGVTILVLDTTRIPEDGGLPAEQVRFLERELSGVKPEQSVIVVTHKPFFRNGVWKGVDDPVHRLFVDHGVDLVVAGHWHDYVYEPHDGVTYMVCGSSGGSTGGQGIENGEFVGFVWGTLRDGRLSIAPIRKEGFLAPDFFNYAEDVTMMELQANGMDLSPFDLAGAAATVTVTMKNAGGAEADSIHWKTPANWTITPVGTPSGTGVGKPVDSRFDLRYAGSPFPLPSLSGVLHYGRNKTLTVTTLLRVERTARGPAARKIKLDGVIDPGEWEGARAEDLLMSPDGGTSACDPAAFYFAHDDRGVYLAARCAFGPEHPVVAKVVTRDGPVHREDCAGWILSPNDSTVVQVYANPVGTLIDGWGKVAGSDVMMDYKWNGDFRVATKSGTDAWSVEIYVPYKTLGFAKGKAPADLRINFRRKQPAVESAADWMPFSFHPTTMGKLDLVM
jgi:hypothetical protein